MRGHYCSALNITTNKIINSKLVSTAINDRFLRPYIIWDIVFSIGQILFLGFALFIIMVYVMNKNWFPVVLRVRVPG